MDPIVVPEDAVIICPGCNRDLLRAKYNLRRGVTTSLDQFDILLEGLAEASKRSPICVCGTVYLSRPPFVRPILMRRQGRYVCVS